jgi:hypothetical protein
MDLFAFAPIAGKIVVHDEDHHEKANALAADLAVKGLAVQVVPPLPTIAVGLARTRHASTASSFAYTRLSRGGWILVAIAGAVDCRGSGSTFKLDGQLDRSAKIAQCFHSWLG